MPMANMSTIANSEGGAYKDKFLGVVDVRDGEERAIVKEQVSIT